MPLSLSLSRVRSVAPLPGTVFCEDFEGVNPESHFDDYDGDPDSEILVMTDVGPSNDAANKVFRFRVPVGQAGGSDLVKVLPSTYDSLYVQWYFKYSGYPFDPSTTE